ncbi:hypothetical protein PSP31121_05321 [Pandoraea sputorum]|uniref:Uncharacterized protein n=1 Tax=Pandoraea sputorum TaxID=93222 RepID=A0A5E5BK18_9BURK|nr:hypothetical protein PSP31121_05321 [Pandoraea sputorum]
MSACVAAPHACPWRAVPRGRRHHASCATAPGAVRGGRMHGTAPRLVSSPCCAWPRIRATASWGAPSRSLRAPVRPARSPRCGPPSGAGRAHWAGQRTSAVSARPRGAHRSSRSGALATRHGTWGPPPMPQPVRARSGPVHGAIGVRQVPGLPTHDRARPGHTGASAALGRRMVRVALSPPGRSFSHPLPSCLWGATCAGGFPRPHAVGRARTGLRVPVAPARRRGLLIPWPCRSCSAERRRPSA